MFPKYQRESDYSERDLELLVTERQTEADGVVSLSFVSANGQELPKWTPGAHLDLTVGEGLTRQYSLCGDVCETQLWKIGVLHQPKGRGGSEFIHENINVGDTLRARGSRNNFDLVDSERYLFIAGGIGITPILPMVRHVASQGRPWTLLYGGRSRQSMAFLDELRKIEGGELIIAPEDEVGLLDLEAYLGIPTDNTSVYCCGPGPLLDVVEALCLEWPAGALQIERFAPSARPIATGDAFDVKVKHSDIKVQVPTHATMLEVLEGAGCVIQSSCRAGICGTCLVYVTEGEPEHHDDLLTDEQQASNKMMLPCVSRSKTASLTIELVSEGGDEF